MTVQDFFRGLFVSCLLILCSGYSAADNFRVEDIRVEGLQRVSAKAVFSALPIKVNTETSTSQIQNAVRELFKTGFFEDIDIARDGNVLIVNVKERPAINRINISGNDIIDTDDLLLALFDIGLSEGNIFKQSDLDKIERELKTQYGYTGRYSTKVIVTTRELDRDRVDIEIELKEGPIASVKHINIIGNQHFTEDELQQAFTIREEGSWSFFSSRHEYGREKFAGDIERLKTFYFDRGYLEFDVVDTQVSLSPDKNTVFISVTVDEGQAYTVSEIELAGDTILPEEEVRALIEVEVGEVFSQEKLTASAQEIQSALGNEGYSFANVRSAPDLDKESGTAKVRFFVSPGKIAYVRRILFKGNEATQDEVLRREMRQLEGAPVSFKNLDLSRARLQRLPLFSEVSMTTEPVAGRDDQIDVIFTVVEQSTGSITASIGYSQGRGAVFGLGLQQQNWLGTGNTFGIELEQNDVESNYSVSFTDPYFTPDGVSRTVALKYQQRDLEELNVSNFSTDTVGVDVSFGYPISEQSRLSLGVGIANISVKPGLESVQEIIGSPRLRSGVQNAYIRDSDVVSGFTDTNGNGFRDEGDTAISSAAASRGTVDSLLQQRQQDGFLDTYGDEFNSLNLQLGWNTSSLNRGIFPTDGGAQRLNFEVGVPGTDLEYYKLIYRNELYRPISKSVTFRFKSRFGYADSFGGMNTLPFFENFFSGGSNSIRGFESSSLGPKGTPAVSYEAAPYADGFAYISDNAETELLTHTDTQVQTIGGNILFESGVEFIFPLPFAKNSKSLRTLMFLDAGNVFSTSCLSTQSNCSNIDLGRLSSAFGAGMQWLSPVGPLSFYFTSPVKKQPFDRTESFQLSLGQSF